MLHKKSLYLALATALISGLSIFLNAWAVKIPQGPLVFTTAKNLVVVLFLLSLLLGLRQWPAIRKLKFSQWLYLILIGLIGGSIPFLLFFKGLSLVDAPTAAFIHKTLFIWVAILAWGMLKEKMTGWTGVGLVLLLGGNLLLFQAPANFWGEGQRLIWLAVAFWTVENIIAKNFFNRFPEIPSLVGAFGRMFFGSIIMFGYLAYIGQAGRLVTLASPQLWWILLTGLLLLGYVTAWYGAIRQAPIHIVTSILVLGSPITTLLTAIFIKHQLSWQQLGAMILLGLGVWLIIRAFYVRTLKIYPLRTRP